MSTDISAAPLGRLPTTTSTRALVRSTSRARQVAVGLVAILLAMLTAATLVACCFATIVPEQLDEGEPLIYGLASRILANRPLYQPIDQQPFVQVHYTPVYYATIAALRQFVGPGFAPGRVLSMSAGLVTATLVGYLTASRARSWWAGGFAVLMFLGLGFPGAPVPFLALERVDVLGVAFSVAAIALLAHRTDRTHLIVAGILAGLAVLTKQSLFAAGLAGTIWLAGHNPRKAGAFVLTSTTTVAVTALLFEWTSGGAFWDNIGPSNPSPTALPFGAYLFNELLVIQGATTLVALVYVVGHRVWGNPEQQLLVIYWLFSTVSILGIIKVGANHNYWIEFAAPNAVLATLCIWKCLHARDKRLIWTIASMLPISLLVVQLGVLTPARFTSDRKIDVIPFSWTLNVAQLLSLANDGSTFKRLVDEVRNENGVVLAESLDVVVLADHPVWFEPFAFSMLEHERRWNSQPLVDDICAGRINLLVLSYPIESDILPVGLSDFPMWPNSVMVALRHSMQREKILASHWVYTTIANAATLGACEAAAAAAR
jgi:hypothetical protein